MGRDEKFCNESIEELIRITIDQLSEVKDKKKAPQGDMRSKGRKIVKISPDGTIEEFEETTNES